MGFANSKVLRMCRQVVAKTGHQSFVEKTASEGLERVVIRCIDAREQAIALAPAMVQPRETVVVVVPERRSGEVVLHLSGQVRKRNLLQKRYRSCVEAV